MTYDRRKKAAADDTDELFGGFYDPKMKPQPALDALVKAYRVAIEEFIKRYKAQEAAGEDQAKRPVVTNKQRLHSLIVAYLLDKYGMEKALAHGLAAQITQGQN